MELLEAEQGVGFHEFFPQDTRLIHCLHPDGSTSIPAHEAKIGERPALLRQIRNTQTRPGLKSSRHERRNCLPLFLMRA